MRDILDMFHHSQARRSAIYSHQQNLFFKLHYFPFIIFLFFLQIGLCSFLWQQSLKRCRKVLGEISANPISQRKKKIWQNARLFSHQIYQTCQIQLLSGLHGRHAGCSKYCKFSPRKEEGNSLKTFHLKYLLKPKSFFLCLNASIAYIILAWGCQSVGLDDLCRSLTTEKTLFYTISSDMQHWPVLKLWCSAAKKQAEIKYLKLWTPVSLKKQAH